MLTPFDYKLFTEVSADYIRGEPMWVVELNSGLKVYRKEIDEEKDSWLRLKDYLYQSDNYIEVMYLRFRDHYEEIARHQEIFFYTNSIGCWYGGSPQYSMVGGYARAGESDIHLKKFSVPELILDKIEYRSINDPTLEKGLIVRGKHISE